MVMMDMLRRMIGMTMTTRVAEVMPLDTKAAEVETNIITIMHNNFSDSDLWGSKMYLLNKIIHICEILRMENMSKSKDVNDAESPDQE